MTAPAAPTIRATSGGSNVFVRWQPVETATDYNLYVKEGAEAWGLEAEYDDSDVNPDGWFFVATSALSGIVTVRVTALNVLAEESDPSNIIQRNLQGDGHEVQQTSALYHAVRSAQRVRATPR